MANDGQIVFEVRADGSHAVSDIKGITNTIEKETQKWDKAAEQSADNIGNNFSSMLKKLVAGFSAAKIGKALLDFGKDAIQAASDLQEVQNVVDTTFGASGAAKIEQWAKAAGTQFGLTETQAKRFTSTLGAMMKSSGMAGSEIVNMSTDLAGLAADMASFYNLDFDTAFQKIRSGISGETEPLKQLGINMSVANLNAYALQQGLSKTFEQMSSGEQTMLRYQYLMSATADAQGDFSRTSDGFANGVRSLQTSMETLKTNVGTFLLPAAQDIVNAINSIFDSGEGTPVTKRHTALDDIAEIDAKTQETIAKISATRETVETLASELETISGRTISDNLQKIVDEIGTVDTGKGKAETLNGFLSALNNNVDALAAIQGKSADGAKEWIAGIAEKANELQDGKGGTWQELIDAITEGIPGLENTTAGAELLANLKAIEETKAGESLQTLAQKISGITIADNAKDLFTQTLATMYENITDISSVTGAESDGVKNWLDGVAAEANSLEDGTPEEWAKLTATLLAGIPGLSDTEAGQTLLNTLTEISGIDAAKTVDDLKNSVDLLGQDTGSVSKVQQIASDLNSIEVSDNLKSTFNQTLATLKNNIDSLAEVKGESAQGVSDWLDRVAASANKLDENDAQGWATLIGELTQGIPGLEGTEEGENFIGKLTETFLAMGQDSEIAAAGLAALGYSTDEIQDKQEKWLATCRALVSEIPGLSSIIDTNTGEVRGGTDAVRKYADEWKRAAQYQAEIEGLKEKKEAVTGLAVVSETSVKAQSARATASAYMQTFEKIPKEVADQFASEAAALVDRIFNGTENAFDKSQDFHLNSIEDLFTEQGVKYLLGTRGHTLGEYEIFDDRTIKALADYLKYEYDYIELMKVKPELEAAFDAAIEETADAYDMTKESLSAEIDTMIEAEKNMSDLEKAARGDEDAITRVATAVDNANTALKSLADYAQGVSDKVSNSVDGVVKSFEKIDYTSSSVIAKINNLTAKQAAEEIGSDKWKDYQRQIDELNASLATRDNMYTALETQAGFMESYLDAITKAQEMGLSDELIASLSDGSVESYQYLNALVNGSGSKTAQEIDAYYQEIQKKKEELKSALTEQQLSADQVYQKMLEDAKEAVAGLDLEDEAKENSGKTVAGIAEGIAGKIPDVKEAVDGILAQLSRLSALGINFNFNTAGGIPVFTPSNRSGSISGDTVTIGSFAVGLDRVPYDGFLASLHEGEGILTEEENKVWQRFKNGGGTDYDTLGGVMRDNIKPGGNVYLDGRIVGSVISDQQGKSFRQLQRSGWQA